MDKVSVSVGPFEVEDPLQLSDWNQPLSFMKSRHVEKIEGEVLQQESWRAKDKVRILENSLFVTDTRHALLRADENVERSACHVYELRRGPSRCRKNCPLCSKGVLDR